MNWKTAYRSIYYQGAPEPEDLDLKRTETALGQTASTVDNLGTVTAFAYDPFGNLEFREARLGTRREDFTHDTGRLPIRFDRLTVSSTGW